mmetsp:Transcript_19561/g.14271  ORF Transcript_19561/g.14271 Transcript_19561/m.14271 type:complete len:87 (+) Transcript_19561:83-343(+)
MNDILAGNWQVASQNVIAATLQLDDASVQIEVAKIFQSLLKDYQASFQKNETVNVTTVISEKEEISAPNVTADFAVAVSGNKTTVI